jgi:hypothetical protein
VFNLQRLAVLTTALARSPPDPELIFEAMKDKIHHPYRMPLVSISISVSIPPSPSQRGPLASSRSRGGVIHSPLSLVPLARTNLYLPSSPYPSSPHLCSLQRPRSGYLAHRAPLLPRTPLIPDPRPPHHPILPNSNNPPRPTRDLSLRSGTNHPSPRYR